MQTRYGVGKSGDWEDEFRRSLFDEIRENDRTQRRNLSDIGREFGINPANVYTIRSRKWFQELLAEEKENDK